MDYLGYKIFEKPRRSGCSRCKNKGELYVDLGGKVLFTTKFSRVKADSKLAAVKRCEAFIRSIKR